MPIKTSGAQSEIRDGVDDATDGANDIRDGVVNIGHEFNLTDGTYRKIGGQ